MGDQLDNTPWVATPWGLEKMNEKCGLCSASCKSTVKLGCCKVEACPICAVKVMTKAVECQGCIANRVQDPKDGKMVKKKSPTSDQNDARTKIKNAPEEGDTTIPVESPNTHRKNKNEKANSKNAPNGDKNVAIGTKKKRIDDKKKVEIVKEVKESIAINKKSTSLTKEETTIIDSKKSTIAKDSCSTNETKNATKDNNDAENVLSNDTANKDSSNDDTDDIDMKINDETPDDTNDKHLKTDAKTPDKTDDKNTKRDVKTSDEIDDKNATSDSKTPSNATCSLCGDYCVCGAITSPTTDILKCSVCGEICKRAVVMRCCKASACRACGIKRITGARACWVERCGREGVTTKDLDNDDVMRQAVDQYKKSGVVEEGHLEELKGRLVKEIESIPKIIEVPKPTPILIEIDEDEMDTDATSETSKTIPQGGTIKCTQNGKDRIILTETNTYSEWRKIPEQDQNKTHSSWRKTPIKTEGSKKPTKATPEYRKGPDNSVVDEEVIKSIPQGGVIHCQQTGTQRIIRTETNTYSGWSKTDDNKSQSGKRKSADTETPKSPVKRFKTLQRRIIYLDIQMIHTHRTKPQIFQLGLSTTTENPSENKQFFQPVVSDTVSGIKSKSALEYLSLSRTDEKTFFNKKSTSDVKVCKEEREAFVEMLDFIQSVKDKFSECAVVTYRSVSIRYFLDGIQRCGLEKRFRGLVTKVGVLEEMLEEKGLWPWLPLKSLGQAYFLATGKTLPSSVSTSDEVARTLEVLASKLATRHKVDIIKMTTPLSKLLAANAELSNIRDKLKMEGGQEEIPPNVLTTENSCNFIGAISVLDSDDECQTEEGEVEQSEVEVLTDSVIYPSLNQPIVTVLKNVDKNVTSVRLKLSNVMTERSAENKWTLFPDPVPVFRMFGKSYAIPRVFTEPVNCEVQKVESVDCLDAATVLGEITEFETEVSKERKLDRLIDLFYTSCRGVDNNISVGPTPVAILVKLKLISKKSSKNIKKNDLFKRSDVFTMEKCNVPEIEVVSSLFSVDPNANYNWRARIVVKSKTNAVVPITEGHLIGRACLVDGEEDLLKAIALAKKQPKPKPVPRKSPPKEEGVEPENERQRCVTLSKVRLYAQCPNCVLLKLSGSSFKSRFSTVTLEYSKEFRNLVRDKNRQDKTGFGLKSSLSQFKSRVSWCEERPYAFININFFGGKQTQQTAFLDLDDNFEVATYTPNDDVIEESKENNSQLSMNVCVDFSVRNLVIDSKATPIEVYLRFKDAVGIDKKQVLLETFYLSKICSEKLDVLTTTFIPKANKSLAPQKTSTNDMRATLIVKSKDDSEVMINAREVIAEATVTSPEHHMTSNKIDIEPAPVTTPDPALTTSEVEMEEVLPAPPEISNPTTETNNVRYPGVRIQNFVVPPVVPPLVTPNVHNVHNLHNLVNQGLRLGMPMYRFPFPGAHLLNPQVVPNIHGAPLFLPTAGLPRMAGQGLPRMAGPRLFYRF